MPSRIKLPATPWKHSRLAVIRVLASFLGQRFKAGTGNAGSGGVVHNQAAIAEKGNVLGIERRVQIKEAASRVSHGMHTAFEGIFAKLTSPGQSSLGSCHTCRTGRPLHRWQERMNHRLVRCLDHRGPDVRQFQYSFHLWGQAVDGDGRLNQG